MTHAEIEIRQRQKEDRGRKRGDEPDAQQAHTTTVADSPTEEGREGGREEGRKGGREGGREGGEERLDARVPLQ